jgi:hypothetical protein
VYVFLQENFEASRREMEVIRLRNKELETENSELRRKLEEMEIRLLKLSGGREATREDCLKK